MFQNTHVFGCVCFFCTFLGKKEKYICMYAKDFVSLSPKLILNLRNTN